VMTLASTGATETILAGCGARDLCHPCPRRRSRCQGRRLYRCQACSPKSLQRSSTAVPWLTRQTTGALVVGARASATPAATTSANQSRSLTRFARTRGRGDRHLLSVSCQPAPQSSDRTRPYHGRTRKPPRRPGSRPAPSRFKPRELLEVTWTDGSSEPRQSYAASSGAVCGLFS